MCLCTVTDLVSTVQGVKYPGETIELSSRVGVRKLPCWFAHESRCMAAAGRGTLSNLAAHQVQEVRHFASASHRRPRAPADRCSSA